MWILSGLAIFVVVFLIGLIITALFTRDAEGGIWVGVFMLAILLVFPIVSIDQQISNQVTIDTNDQLVSIYSDQLNSINTDLNNLKVKGSSFMNADTPYASIIKAKVRLTTKLTSVKVLKHTARIKILERERGGFWWVPKFVSSFQSN